MPTPTAFGPGAFGLPAFGPPAFGGGRYEPSLDNPPDTLVDAVVARLYLYCGGLVSWIGTGMAPAGLPSVLNYPYAQVVEVTETNQDTTTTGDYVASGQIQVNVYAHGKSLARSVSKAFSRCLNDAPMVFGDGNLMKFRHNGRPIVLQDPADGAAGNDVWQESRVYLYMLSGNYSSGD